MAGTNLQARNGINNKRVVYSMGKYLLMIYASLQHLKDRERVVNLF